MALIREVKSERSFRHLSGLKVVSLNLTMCSPVVRFEKQAKRNLWSLITNRMILFLKGYVAKKYKWECTLFVESNAYDETTSLFYDWEYQWNLEFFGEKCNECAYSCTVQMKSEFSVSLKEQEIRAKACSWWVLLVEVSFFHLGWKMIEALIIERLSVAFARLIQKIFWACTGISLMSWFWSRLEKMVANSWQTFLGIFGFGGNL